MKKFHLMQVVPPHRHKLLGCNELIETIKWGLEQLGHEVSHAINSYELGRTNIIFGAQILPIEFMSNFPADTIIYNTEQMVGIDPLHIRPEMQFYAQHFQIWDYKRENLASWASLGNTTAKFVPVGYAPILTRIAKPAQQDIDILIYGLVGETRLKAFELLSNAGFSIAFVCGLYGDARDSLIARSKIILNVNIFQMCQQFEIVRVSYLLANKKAVITVVDENTTIEEEMKSCIKVSTLENLVADCCELIDNDAPRTRFEQTGFETFSRCDITRILKDALM